MCFGEMVINLLPFNHSLTLARFLHWAKFLNNKRSKRIQSGSISSSTTSEHVNKLVLTAFVHSLVKIHIHSCRNEGTVSISDKHVTRIHNSLYIALRLCFELNLRSTKLVSELIQEIFLCEGSLHSIFSIMSIGQLTRKGNPITNVNNVHTVLLYPGAHSFNFEEVKPALTYYLKNILPVKTLKNESNLLQFVPSQIMNDTINDGEVTTLLMAATMRKEPDMVLTLLRYGADPLVLSGDEESNAQTPMQYIIKCLNSIAVIKNYTWLQAQNDVAKEETKALEMFGYFLRAVLHVDIRQTVELKFNTDDGEEEIHYYTAHQKLAERINISYFRNPPSLHHICRYNIRQLIRDAAKDTIPESIKMLPLPVPEQDYLDLKA